MLDDAHVHLFTILIIKDRNLSAALTVTTDKAAAATSHSCGRGCCRSLLLLYKKTSQGTPVGTMFLIKRC